MHRLKQNDTNDTYKDLYLKHLTLFTLINALLHGSVGVLLKLCLMMKHSQKVMMLNYFTKKGIRMDGVWRY